MEEKYRNINEFRALFFGNLEWTIEKFYTEDAYYDAIVLETVNGGYYDNYGIKDLHLGLRRIKSCLDQLQMKYPDFKPVRVILNKGRYVLYRG